MTTELFIKIAMAVISFVSALVTAFLIPWLKSKVNQQELEKVFEYAAVAVRCAEQIYSPDQWREKKNYVLQYVKNVVNDSLNINLTDNDLDTIIEGIVFEIKHENELLTGEKA